MLGLLPLGVGFGEGAEIQQPLALTLIAAFQGFAGMVPCVIFAGLQFCAALYYFLSYIPGGQRGCRMLCERTTGVELPKAP